MKAYPYMHKHPTSGQTTISEGMDLRDYFAAKAMQGLMHNYHPCDFLEHKGWLEDISMASYQMADAMMKQRQIKDVSE
jgi:hypothetical protein